MIINLFHIIGQKAKPIQGNAHEKQSNPLFCDNRHHSLFL